MSIHPHASMDPRLLESFRVVAEQAKVSSAARLLNLSQPALTARIRQLESETGHALFIRHPGGMRLTEHGGILLDYARRVQGLLLEASERLRGERDLAGELRLGASTTAAAYILPSLLGGFLARHRPAPVVVEVDNTEAVLGWVREGRIALGLVEGLTRARGVSLEPYLQDELVAVRPVGASGPLAAVRRAADLASVPMIRREPGSGTRAVLERALRQAGLPDQPKPADLVVGDTETIKSCVLAGLGIGFLSRWSIQRELRGSLEIIPLPDLRVPRRFSWAHGSGGLAGPLAAFHAFALRHPPGLHPGPAGP
jgi:DNA-binding transcriptional LysR family regulator